MSGTEVAIVGGGIVGRNWAVLFAKAGYGVRLFDVQEAQVDAAIADIRDTKLPLLVREGMLSEAEAEAALARIHPIASLADAVRGNVVHVQTCVPEDLALKKKVFEELAAAVEEAQNDVCVLGSSTSNIDPKLFSQDLPPRVRERVVVCHPINPPLAVALVEICRSPFTTDAVVSRTRKLFREIGMRPIVLNKAVDGFIVNRLQYALLSEALRLVEDDVATPEDVDAALTAGLAHRWAVIGPFETISLNAPDGVVDYDARYTDSIMRVLASQDNSRRWSAETVRRVDAAFPVRADNRQAKVRRRDELLLRLRLHTEKQRSTQDVVENKEEQ